MTTLRILLLCCCALIVCSQYQRESFREYDYPEEDSAPYYPTDNRQWQHPRRHSNEIRRPRPQSQHYLEDSPPPRQGYPQQSISSSEFMAMRDEIRDLRKEMKTLFGLVDMLDKYNHAMSEVMQEFSNMLSKIHRNTFNVSRELTQLRTQITTGFALQIQQSRNPELHGTRSWNGTTQNASTVTKSEPPVPSLAEAVLAHTSQKPLQPGTAAAAAATATLRQTATTKPWRDWDQDEEEEASRDPTSFHAYSTTARLLEQKLKELELDLDDDKDRAELVQTIHQRVRTQGQPFVGRN